MLSYQTPSGLAQRLIYLPLFLLVLALYFWGTAQQRELVNTDMHEMDQSAYMTYAKKIAETDGRYIGGRGRMPGYPALMSLFYRADMPDDLYFDIGKKVGIGLGIVVSLAVAALFFRSAKLFDALVATGVAVFTVIVYKAPYFQAELLFYLFFFLLFYLISLILYDLNLGLAALAGALAGVTHLIKASLLPFVVLVSTMLIVRLVFEVRHQSRSRLSSEDRSGQPILKTVYRHCCALLLFLFFFLAVLWPYIDTSKARFGKYFYNVNSTFYVWYNSWEEVEAGTRAHGDRVGWPDMPATEIPSFQKYIRDHSVMIIPVRIAYGYRNLLYYTSNSFGYAEFMAIYLLFLGGVFFQNRAVFQPENFSYQTIVYTLFVLGFFIGYSILFSWFSAIAIGSRFVLSLFLPGLFVILQCINYAAGRGLSFRIGELVLAPELISVVVLLYFLSYLAFRFPYQIGTMFAGS